MKRIVIISSPYSGTRHISKVLNKAGIDVGHEHSGLDGIVSWYHADWTKSQFVSEGYSNDTKMIHLVRHPLMTISTLMACIERPWPLFRKMLNREDIDGDLIGDGSKKLHSCMKVWHGLNVLCERHTIYRIGIEELPSKWAELLNILEIPPCDMPGVNKTEHRHGWSKIYSWNYLYRLNPRLTTRILNMASKYKYHQTPTYYLDDPFYEFPEQIELSEVMV